MGFFRIKPRFLCTKSIKGSEQLKEKLSTLTALYQIIPRIFNDIFMHFSFIEFEYSFMLNSFTIQKKKSHIYHYFQFICFCSLRSLLHPNKLGKCHHSHLLRNWFCCSYTESWQAVIRSLDISVPFNTNNQQFTKKIG